MFIIILFLGRTSIGDLRVFTYTRNHCVYNNIDNYIPSQYRWMRPDLFFWGGSSVPNLGYPGG